MVDERRKRIWEWLENGGSIKGGVDGDGTPAAAGTPEASGTPEKSSTPATPSNEELITKWKELLPEDVRKSPMVAESKAFTDFAVQAVNAQKMIGGRIPIPKDEKDTKAWGEVYDKLGRPKDVAGYKIERPSNGDSIGYSETIEKSFLAVAHEEGLNSKQANRLIKWQSEAIAQSMAESNAAIETATVQLKKDWGNQYAERVATVQRVVSEYAASYPGLIEALEKNNIGSNPAFVKFFFDNTEGLVEAPAGGGGGGGNGMTPEQAATEIKTLLGTKEFSDAYYNKRNPGHEAAVNKIFELRNISLNSGE